MRLGPVVHGGLLAVALVVSYQGATRTKGPSQAQGTHAVWKLGNLSALVLEAQTKTVRIERRSDENGPYLWGRIDRTRTVTKPAATEAPAVADDAGPGAAAAVPETETTVRTREFPIGEAGEELMQQFQTLMALRKIGAIGPEKLEDYNLHEKTITVSAIEEGKGQHELLLAGEKIYGGTDRYVLDVEQGMGYVLSGKLVQPLESAESSLGLKAVHIYDETLVKTVAVKTTAGDKVLVKSISKDEKGEHVVWENQDAPGTPDPSLSSFIERVTQLKPTLYDVELDVKSLVHMATLRYRDASDTSLGYLELYRQLPSAQTPSGKPGETLQTQYYIKTERTRVLGKVGRLVADRVDQDLVELFGIAPPPAVVEPAPAPAVVAPSPAPAVVAPSPAPAVVAPSPAPAVVAPSPAPAVVAPAPAVVAPAPAAPAAAAPPTPPSPASGD